MSAGVAETERDFVDLLLRGEILRPDGSEVYAGALSGAAEDGADMGRELAERLLVKAGGGFFA